MLSFNKTVIFFVTSLTFFSLSNGAESNKKSPSRFVSQEVWEKVQDYLIPDDHPIKGRLDALFSRTRVLANKHTLVESGFSSAEPQRFTKITVTNHPDFKGYIFKIYLDSNAVGPKGNLEEYYFMKRIDGIRLARESIKKHHFEELIVTPDKWIYLLPDEPTPNPKQVHRRFILIEDDMNIVSDKKKDLKLCLCYRYLGSSFTHPFFKLFRGNISLNE